MRRIVGPRTNNENPAQNAFPSICRTNPSANSDNSSVRHFDDHVEAPPMEEYSKCMVVSEDSSRIAFACYDEERNEIVLEQNRFHVNERDSQRIVEAFLTSFNPNLILVSGKTSSNATLMDLLTNAGQSHQEINTDGTNHNSTPQDGNTNVTSTRIKYQLLKSKAFDLRNCKSLILNKLRVLTLLQQQSLNPTYNDTSNKYCMNEHGGTRISTQHTSIAPSRYHSLASVIDFDSSVIVRAVGALLSHLQGTIFRMEEGSTVTINSIRYAGSSQFMFVDNQTLQSLHIFATEQHPLLAQGKGQSKEGFSLFTLLDRTKSKIGRKCLKQWMLRPLLSPSEIMKRYDGIDFFLNPNVHTAVTVIMNLLNKVGAIDKILLRMKKCVSLPMDFIILQRSLSAAISIYSALTEEFSKFVSTRQGSKPDDPDDQTGDASFIEDVLMRSCVSTLTNIQNQILSIIDEDGTIESKDSVVIQRGFNVELDTAKKEFETLDDTLSEVGSQVLSKDPNLKQVKVVFLPQVGFLINLDKRHHTHNIATNEFPELPQDFTFIFTQGNDVYFKNPYMRQLDDEIGDLDAFIKDVESMIVSKLEEDILDCECALRRSFDAIADLDCILAFAGCSSDQKYKRPQIMPHENILGGDCGISIINGRHPLQEIVFEEEFIPNDTFINEKNRVNIITGPNFSGKSCYLRQVGILVYMAQIGCFIPCEKAEISITDQILAKINNIETCSVPQSSFQLDLTQMASIMRRCTQRSLILIDEFGKGTNPASGISVLTAALRKLAKTNCKILCATHFLEIFTFKLFRDNENGIRALQMSVHVPDKEEDNAVPLFKLKNGVANSSAGLVCAKMASVDSTVITRANEILRALKYGNPVKPVSFTSNANSSLQPKAKAALMCFLSTESWLKASVFEFKSLEEKIMSM